MTTFELVPDDEREDGSGGTDDGPDGGGRPPVLRDRAVARWHALSRRGRVAVAASAAVVVVAAATAAVGPGLLDARAERLRAEAVQGLPGAAGDLSEPLDETWELVGGDGALVSLAGGAVLTTEGTTVTARDAASGEEVWRREVGTFPTCGPQGGYQDDLGRPADVVTCVSGPPDNRTVTVLDAGGVVVGERSIGPAQGDTYDDWTDDGTGEVASGAPVVMPAGGDALAVVEGYTHTTVPWPSDDQPDAGTLRELRAAGWTDPTLRVEDALTGEVRAEAALRLRPEDLPQCGTMQDDGAAPELMASPSVTASSSLVTLSVCNAAVLASPDGVVFDTGTDSAWARTLPGGGLVVVGEESTVLGPDGAVVATVPGLLIPPTVDDDPEGPSLVLAGLGTAGGQIQLAAVGADGDEAWRSDAPEPGGVLARVSGVVVVQVGDGFVGLDAATGAETWARDDLLDTSSYASGEWVAGAVTDGTRLLIGIGGDGEHHRLVALDLRDGSTAWQQERQGYLEWVQAVDGHVVAFDGTLHGLG